MIPTKTSDPQITNINLFYKKEFYSKATNFLSTMDAYLSELQTAIDFNKTKTSNDVIKSQQDFFVELDNKMKQMQPQFAAFWIEKFKNSFLEVKNQVLIKTSGGTFYRAFSDSIGAWFKTENYLDDSTQYVSDIQGSNTLTPLRLGGSLMNKISPATLLLHAQLSKATNLIYRKNLQNIQEVVTTPNKAHGNNLIPDIEHIKRMQNSVAGLTQKIITEYKELYSVINFYCSYNPRSSSNNVQIVPNAVLTVNIEGQQVGQDFLFNQVKDLDSKLTSMKVLGLS